MPHTDTAHGQLFYAQRGQGAPPLIFVHGAGGSHEHWAGQLASLGALTHTLLLDLPGHGRSPGAGCSSIAAYSAALLAFMDALGLERAVLAGHSMGGAVALHTALHTPVRVAGMVLAATGARLKVAPAFLDGLAPPVRKAADDVVDTVTDTALDGPYREAVKTMMRTMMGNMYGSAATDEMRARAETSFSAIDPRIFRNDLLACNAFDVRPRLGELACPVLVLCGEEDAMVPLKFSRLLHEQIPGAALECFPATGHMLPVEQAEAVGAAIGRWFTSQYRSG